jgi:hypothetical protein
MIALDTNILIYACDKADLKQDDLERSLFERVQRFLMYFGKPEDSPAALPEPRTGKP